MLQLLQPCKLQIDVVVIIEVVEADNRIAAREQTLRDMHADEAGSAGDEDFHEWLEG